LRIDFCETIQPQIKAADTTAIRASAQRFGFSIDLEPLLVIGLVTEPAAG
jgi:hypothetical protein